MKQTQAPQQQRSRGKRDRPGTPPPTEAVQQTWVGGGREPADPDDVGDDGEYISMENRRRMDGAGSSDS